jgi:hypothetical protein
LNWDGNVEDLSGGETEESAAGAYEIDLDDQHSNGEEALRPAALFVPKLVHPVRKSWRIEQLSVEQEKPGKVKGKGGRKRGGKR